VETTDEDDAVWAEARRKADVSSLKLEGAPVNVRLSLCHIATYSENIGCGARPLNEIYPDKRPSN
jgi:hypothetical protein